MSEAKQKISQITSNEKTPIGIIDHEPVFLNDQPHLLDPIDSFQARNSFAHLVRLGKKKGRNLEEERLMQIIKPNFITEMDAKHTCAGIVVPKKEITTVTSWEDLEVYTGYVPHNVLKRVALHDPIYSHASGDFPEFDILYMRDVTTGKKLNTIRLRTPSELLAYKPFSSLEKEAVLRSTNASYYFSYGDNQLFPFSANEYIK